METNGNADGYLKFPKVAAKQWVFWSLGLCTVINVSLSLLVFHLGLDDMPREIFLFWACSLFLYCLIKEAFRWFGLNHANSMGEIFTLLIIAGFFWMETVNLWRHWIRHLPYRDLPLGYFEGTVEATILLVFSLISHLVFHCKKVCSGANGKATTGNGKYQG